MTHQDSYPHPVSDPAAVGLPEYADDDSTAYDDVQSPREADGLDPAPLPPDREDGPLVLDEFGTTAEEQREGESLDTRLAREEPDVLEELNADPAPATGDVSQSITDEQSSLDRQLRDETPVDPHLDSAVSMYDRTDDDAAGGGLVGRLVEPDEGFGTDTEGDAVAYDAGAAGGGASAEETAIHEVGPDSPGGPGEGSPGDGYLR